ncbi:ribonuclease P protein subunit p30 [Sitophilus oryzae]|uniref:Ribonuclease P protein subunit p30 n=1 Tax=Sitophilus oryzae TaxID=7048 RepID=A0A6J2X9U9_SITOR|nr:ribonuclease P protein subunit p30 [Sitophilus oryzae]
MQNLKTKGYYDLNIHKSCFENEFNESFLKILYSFGYRTIAISQTIEDTNLEPKSKKKKKGESRDLFDVVPDPLEVDVLKKTASRLGLTDFTFLTRLTIKVTFQENLHRILKSPNYKKYGLVGFVPMTHTAFMFVCSNVEADIISFDPENKIPIRLSRKVYSKLVDKGYHFELLYGPAIEDSTKRRNLIQMAHLFHTFGKSRNIIISSGAVQHNLIRSPYDIINLGLLYGLNELQSRNAVLFCPRNVIVNSVGRRHGKAVMLIENVVSEESAEEILNIDDSDDADMEVDEPAAKKSKSVTENSDKNIS